MIRFSKEIVRQGILSTDKADTSDRWSLVKLLVGGFEKGQQQKKKTHGYQPQMVILQLTALVVEDVKEESKAIWTASLTSL